MSTTVMPLMQFLPYSGVTPEALILKDGSVVVGVQFEPVPVDGANPELLSIALSRVETMAGMFETDMSLEICMVRSADLQEFLPPLQNIEDKSTLAYIRDCRRRHYYRLASSGIARIDYYRFYITIHPGENRMTSLVDDWSYFKGAAITPVIDQVLRQRMARGREAVGDMLRVLDGAGCKSVKPLSGVDLLSDVFHLVNGLAPVGRIPATYARPMDMIATGEVDFFTSPTPYMTAGSRFCSLLSMVNPPTVDFMQDDVPSIFRRIHGIRSDFCFKVTIEPLDRGKELSRADNNYQHGRWAAMTVPRLIGKITKMEQEDVEAKIDKDELLKADEAGESAEYLRGGKLLALTQGLFMVTAKDTVELGESVSLAVKQFKEAFQTTVKTEQHEKAAVFLSMLPGAGYRGRRKTRQLLGVGLRFSPLIGNLYRIGKKSSMPLFTKTGSCFNYDPFMLGDGARNKVMVATTGGGKSMFKNVQILSKLEDDPRFVVIDIGGSYEKQVRLHGGYYFALKVRDGVRPIRVNPFYGLPAAWKAKSDPNRRDEWVEEASGSSYFVELLLRGDKTRLDPEVRGAVSEMISNLAQDASDQGYEPTLEHLKDIMRGHRDYSSLAHALTPFCNGGDFDGMFNREVGEAEMARLAAARIVVFDLKGMDTPQFQVMRTVLFSAISKFVLSVMDKQPDVPKFLDIDEAKIFLADPDAGKMIDYVAQRCRKHGMCLTVIVQSPDYLLDNPFGKSILDNTDETIFLAAKDTASEGFRKMGCTEDEIRIIQGLETVPKHYSEIYIRSKCFGRAVLQLRVSPEEYWIATSDPADATRFTQAYIAARGDIRAAVEKLS